jgi:predicted MFS family arabinose efflux permease
MPSFGTLLPVRVITMLAAAVFTPQAAAAISVLAPPARRGRAITYIFLGWSLASVLGMPAHSYVAETLGWRWAFALVAVLSIAAAWGVWRALPGGVRPAPMSLRHWGAALSNPLFMAMVAVTALSGAGQFTLFSYFAPYYRQELGASAGGVSFLFLWFGAFGLLGNLLLSRSIDRWGAARCVNFTLALMALSLAAWPLAASVTVMTLVLVPWALGCFASNSAQQARLSGSTGAFAPALLALNTSAIYLGQAVGAGSGGVLLTAGGYASLSWAALAWMALAIAVSVWVGRRMRAAPSGHG